MENETPKPPLEPKLKCGIIMPISAMDGYPTEHWKDVLKILQDAIGKAGFEGELVSEADEVNIIQKTIIQNLYDNQVVVCDISGRNANVMFELGMRLTFDKPTVIVCDDATKLPFDTSLIMHIIYLRTLRYQQIEDLKIDLIKRIKASYKAFIDNTDYSPFLKHFGEFVVPKLNQKEVSTDQFIINSINELKQDVKQLRNGSSYKNSSIVQDMEDRIRYRFMQKIDSFLKDNEYSMEDYKSDSRIRDVLKDELMEFEPEIKFHSDAARISFIDAVIKDFTKGYFTVLGMKYS